MGKRHKKKGYSDEASAEEMMADGVEEEALEDEVEDEEPDVNERRSARRRRRIRNQIIVYFVILIVLAGFAAGGVVAGRQIALKIHDKRQEAALEKEQEEALAAASKEEAVVDTPEPVVEEEPQPEEDILGELAASYYSEMSPEDKVAALFVVTPEALTGVNKVTKAGQGTQDALAKRAVGGLIYFEQNLQDKEQITQMLSNTVSMSKYPIFLAVEEEGGDVSRVAKSGIEAPQVGDMAQIGAGGDAAKAEEAGMTIGSYLKELGFNVDFAPVADVAAGEMGALGSRSFGSDPKFVGEMVSKLVGGLEGTGVSACLKTFPGIGSAQEDAKKGRVELAKSMEEFRAADFVPFQAGIEAGADFVMVGHATAPAIDEENIPSSLSAKVMTDTLRGELGFQGVVVTDALNAAAITEYYTPEEAAVMAIEAGADLLLMPEDFEKAYQAVLAALQGGKITEERINESLDRIYRVKCAGKLEEGGQ